ncbi:MAG TPA: response regulator transcription factor [Ktedonobacteraceae bacterium]|nr:response regulator transcription factor [Ktedonobacteraceae bacterium]
MSRTILVVDDDKKTVDLIRLYLEREKYRVLAAHDGQQALQLARQRNPSLVILDWMLPQVDGIDVCRILRAESQVPIIMLTAKAAEEDMLLGLDQGADDYLTKPFSPRELVARVRVVLRRSSQQADDLPEEELTIGPFRVDFRAHEVRLHGRLIDLTPKEFKILETLMREPGRVFSRLELVKRVFGMDYEGFERTVDVHIMNLRKKIEPHPNEPVYLQTVYGVGYKFRREET